MAEKIGGGVAPGRRGTAAHKAKVRLVPYWVPWDADNTGSWRLLPMDTTHTAMLIDENNQQTQVYEAKGFIPERFASEEQKRLLVAKAQHAVEVAAKDQLPAPDWAQGVLGRYPELVKSKASAGANAA